LPEVDDFDALYLIAFINARQGRFGETLAGFDRALAVATMPTHSTTAV
jgi:hypothetical protein